MQTYIPRFLDIGSELFNENIKWLKDDFNGKKIIIAYEADPESLTDADHLFLNENRYVLTDGNGNNYNLALGRDAPKGNPRDPNSL